MFKAPSRNHLTVFPHVRYGVKDKLKETGPYEGPLTTIMILSGFIRRFHPRGIRHPIRASDRNVNVSVLKFLLARPNSFVITLVPFLSSVTCVRRSVILTIRKMIVTNKSVQFAALLLTFCNFMICQAWNSGLKEKYDGYGEDWIFMPDGNDQPQVAVLKHAETDARGIFDESQVSYILYTRYTPKNGTQLYTNDTTGLSESSFNPSRQTKFITHGWKSSAMSGGLINMKEAYLSFDDCNVVMVDWQPLAASTFYLGPMRNTERVGKTAAEFIEFLVTETGLQTENIHFLGHSLGAHVAGNVGSSLTSGRLGRITGLDPALPGFHLLTTDKTRLDSTDALFVDVIHSCGGVLGYLQPLGSADFYPNAGTAVQPGCCCIPEVVEACSHGRSYVYFTESIVSRAGFVARKCNTWDQFMSGNCNPSDTAFMGEHVDKTASGTYFLRTRSESPYAYQEEITENTV